MEYNMEYEAAGAGVGIVVGIIYLAIILLMLVSIWKIFAKAGEPGWAALIPIYNTIVMLKIAGKPIWWILLFLVPFINIIFIILTMMGLAERFGKDKVVWGLLLSFLGIIFFPVLAFSDAEYQG